MKKRLLFETLIVKKKLLKLKKQSLIKVLINKIQTDILKTSERYFFRFLV